MSRKFGLRRGSNTLKSCNRVPIESKGIKRGTFLKILYYCGYS